MCPCPVLPGTLALQKGPEIGIQAPRAGHEGSLISAPHARMGALVRTPGFPETRFLSALASAWTYVYSPVSPRCSLLPSQG